jgi:hypothetical protein
MSRILAEDSGFDLIETWKDQRLRKLEDYTNHFTFDTSEPLRQVN